MISSRHGSSAHCEMQKIEVTLRKVRVCFLLMWSITKRRGPGCIPRTTTMVPVYYKSSGTVTMNRSTIPQTWKIIVCSERRFYDAQRATARTLHTSFRSSKGKGPLDSSPRFGQFILNVSRRYLCARRGLMHLLPCKGLRKSVSFALRYPSDFIYSEVWLYISIPRMTARAWFLSLLLAGKNAGFCLMYTTMQRLIFLFGNIFFQHWRNRIRPFNVIHSVWHLLNVCCLKLAHSSWVFRGWIPVRGWRMHWLVRNVRQEWTPWLFGRVRWATRLWYVQPNLYPLHSLSSGFCLDKSLPW